MPRPGRPQRENIYALGVEPRSIRDPGDTGTIVGNETGYVELISTGAETRTLADPVFRGQTLDLIFITNGGDITITSSSPVNQTGHTSLVCGDVGDHVRLVGFFNATDGWEWREVVNDGWTIT